jgi:hypothetical protein
MKLLRQNSNIFCRAHEQTEEWDGSFLPSYCDFKRSR